MGNARHDADDPRPRFRVWMIWRDIFQIVCAALLWLAVYVAGDRGPRTAAEILYCNGRRVRNHHMGVLCIPDLQDFLNSRHVSHRLTAHIVHVQGGTISPAILSYTEWVTLPPVNRANG